ncbi:UDP-glucose 4-epimerase GalE [Chlorobium sp. N1]|uniref:UDP-glucose 4-epimerase GalE n=1 Tax=Chlorobium sp. N1 TaxID=2491138 RepID=UPI001038DDB7|nr:UDP-glucose 4-epimerase GalE [Chlorobium sp. N1]TCD47590.1 UDP-glucose 4-epimerase GalE [Chlorobium sp. N1]
MRILVIGGAGYIGSHVVRAFLDSGHEVTVFDNLRTGLRENLFPEAAFVHGDIMHPLQLRAAMAPGFDGLVHLAALKAAGQSMLHPEEYAESNLTGTINILNEASRAGIRRFIFSSSAAVYGSPAYLPIDEEHPKDPENFYGFTKLEIERLLDWFDRLKGMRYAAIRYFNAAGYDTLGRIGGLELQPENLLPIVMEAACGQRPKLSVYGDDYPTRDGSCIRDYVHVTDLAEAHVRAFDYVGREDRSLTVNLGSERGVTVLEMIERARALTGRPIEAEIAGRRAGDPAELVASSRKARELLGWVPRFSDVDTLISSTWNMYERVCSK